MGSIKINLKTPQAISRCLLKCTNSTNIFQFVLIQVIHTTSCAILIKLKKKYTCMIMESYTPNIQFTKKMGDLENLKSNNLSIN